MVAPPPPPPPYLQNHQYRADPRLSMLDGWRREEGRQEGGEREGGEIRLI